MGIHHIAIATPDLAATHAFYTEAMGFELIKVVTGPTPEGGWAKHAFYDSGDGALIAFWDLHVDVLPPVGGAFSRDVGLPDWVNHIAFRAPDVDAFDAARSRWTGLGLDVFEVDHGFCRSIYANDPSQTMVEWCLDTRPLDDTDRQAAQIAIADPLPAWDEPPRSAVLHPGDASRRPPWAS